MRDVIAALLCVTAAAARIIVGPHITDDAYITMRYSRNLSLTGVMSYNPPDAVLGTSTPLWTWILAAASAAGAAPETTAVVAAAVADMCSIVLILTTPAAGSLAAIGAAATIAGWPAYVMYSVSGMETSLYVLIVVGFVAALSRQRTALSAVAASFGFLCRPDGALLLAIGFAWTLLSRSRTAILGFAATATLLCAPWVIYAFVRFGSVVPASLTAKAAATDPWFLSLQNLFAYFFQGFYAPLTLLAVVGFVVIAKSGGTFWRAWAVWAWTYLAGMTTANAFTHFPWYFVPLLPVYTASATLAVEAATARVGGWHLCWKGGWHRWHESCAGAEISATSFKTPAARIVLAVVLSAALLNRMPPLKVYLDATAAGREMLYASVATQLARVDARCTVAATEIGTIGYYYPGRVLDLVGLVSPEAVGRPADTVLAESRARWLVTYDTHFDRTVAASAPFSNLFERRSTVRISDARTLEIYERRDPPGCRTP